MLFRVRVALFLLLFLPGLLFARGAEEVQEVAKEPLRLGMVPFVGEATSYYAVYSGLAGRLGVQVEPVPFNSGFEALQALRRGEVDLCTVEPTPVINAALRVVGEPDFFIIASILESSEINNVVLLSEEVEEGGMDLAGATVGLPMGTSTEYYWHLFATLQGFSPTAGTELRDLTVPEILAAAQDGELDAAVIWAPYDRELQRRGGTVVDPGRIYTTNWLLLGNPQYLSEREEDVLRYLEALRAAQGVMKENPEALSRVQAEKIGQPAAAFLEGYSRLHFDLALTETLLINLHQQAEWMRQDSAPDGRVPDFRTFISARFAEAVVPDRVRLLDR